jgi:ATP-dependent Clp protease adaptor protein ClpS
MSVREVPDPVMLSGKSHAPWAADTQPGVLEEKETSTSLDRPWNVIVWDDPVNLMSYVVYVFQRLLGFSLEKATTKMMEVHNEGRSLVASEPRERAEVLVAKLHAYGLQASMERPES